LLPMLMYMPMIVMVMFPMFMFLIFLGFTFNHTFAYL
jgi:hypothetical protein